MSAKITLANTYDSKHERNSQSKKSRSKSASIKWTKFIEDESHAKNAIAAIKELQT